MKKILMLLAVASLFFAACEKENDDPANNGGNDPEQPITPPTDTVAAKQQMLIGSWSGWHNPDVLEDVYLHYTFRPDGTFEEIIPGWEERRWGTYTADGSAVHFTVLGIEWLWDRGNGYKDAYDEKYVADYDEWKATYPEDYQYSLTYNFDSKGHLFLRSPNDAELTYFNDPDYTPRRPEVDTTLAKQERIVDEWSGVLAGEEGYPENCFVHFSIKADGTFDMIMQAWGEHRVGTYSFDGNIISFHVQKLEYLWDRHNNLTVYEEYGNSNFSEWAQDHPDEANFSGDFTFNDAGHLLFGMQFLGLDLVFVNDPNFVPQNTDD